MKLAKAKIENQKYVGLNSPTDSLLKGSSFPNLYEAYKFEPARFYPINSRLKELLEYQKYNLQLVDLALFLDIYPENKVALNDYKQVLESLNSSKIKYEREYGPLTIESIFTTNTGSWSYYECPWPWEVEE